MNTEQVVVKILADSSQYERTMKAAGMELWKITRRMETMGQKMGLPKEKLAADVTAIIEQFQRLEQAHRQMVAKTTARSLTMPVFTRAASGGDMAEFRRLMGLTGGTSGASAAQLAGIRGLQRASGPGFVTGGSIGATPQQIQALRMLGVKGISRAPGGGGGGEPEQPDWYWKSSIIGGAFGRMFGGRLGGLGGLIGGGVGGPMGALAGGGIGTILNAGFTLAESAIDGVISGLKEVVSLTYRAGFAALQLGMDYERVSVAFRVMSGSAETGNMLLNQIRKLAIETPYTFKELSTQGQVL
jgi:hypothetical protein